MMTKKHYVAIARSIKSQIDASRRENETYAVLRLESLAEDLAEFMSRDNRKFSMDRFIDAATGPTF